MARRPRLEFDLGEFERRSLSVAERALRAAALAGEAAVKVKLSEAGTGRTYPRGKSAVHVASAPGQPPAPDTGRLRSSTTHEVTLEAGAVIGRVIVNSEQALALELGTERVAPRPFLRPSVPVLFDLGVQAIRRFFARL